MKGRKEKKDRITERQRNSRIKGQKDRKTRGQKDIKKKQTEIDKN